MKLSPKFAELRFNTIFLVGPALHLAACTHSGEQYRHYQDEPHLMEIVSHYFPLPED